MVVGILMIDLMIPYQETIKERRNIIRSLKDMIRKKFNVSVSEVTDTEEVNSRAQLAVAAVSNDGSYIQSILENVYNLVDSFHGDKIISYKTELIQYE
ncbi:MAG: DUF503 domain-containing protein [Brevinematales bacterium]|nr:DUF503 domain-containing protein [Brevinematales bacterium]